MQFVIRFIISTLAVIITSYLLPGVHLESFLTAVIVAAVLSFLNAVVKPVMIFFTIPITLFTFGLFLIIINGAIIMLADKLVVGFEVKNFFAALLFSIMMWLITSILETLTRKREENS